jgi:lysophospholipase L1-like esterase
LRRSGVSSADVEVRNLGVNGLTSGQLRAGIEGDRRVKDAVGRADVVTINIGANDLLRARSEYRSGGCGGADN